MFGKMKKRINNPVKVLAIYRDTSEFN